MGMMSCGPGRDGFTFRVIRDFLVAFRGGIIPLIGVDARRHFRGMVDANTIPVWVFNPSPDTVLEMQPLVVEAGQTQLDGPRFGEMATSAHRAAIAFRIVATMLPRRDMVQFRDHRRLAYWANAPGQKSIHLGGKGSAVFRGPVP